ncbi:hypothetical protein [Actinoplanes sp. ATCC 53533]|uniref:hypothetical protein n=1 Tax=Actinoplanes sp. ATCC 53533 TaxID=1288362 RepID=UPI000F7ADB0E|nr:hypothetical protein [Actinoplanes sp. ATCC 53533]
MGRSDTRHSPAAPYGLSTRAVIERRLASHRDDVAFLVIAVEGSGLPGQGRGMRVTGESR